MLLSSFAAVLFDWHDRYWYWFWMPLVPTAFFLIGSMAWRFGWWKVESDRFAEKYKAQFFTSVSAVICAVVYWAVWHNVWLVKQYMDAGQFSTVTGAVRNYKEDGKDASFDVNGQEFGVTCCWFAPIYNGTPTDGGPIVLHEGMRVKIDYVNDDWITRIESIP